MTCPGFSIYMHDYISYVCVLLLVFFFFFFLFFSFFLLLLGKGCLRGKTWQRTNYKASRWDRIEWNRWKLQLNRLQGKQKSRNLISSKVGHIFSRDTDFLEGFGKRTIKLYQQNLSIEFRRSLWGRHTTWSKFVGSDSANRVMDKVVLHEGSISPTMNVNGGYKPVNGGDRCKRGYKRVKRGYKLFMGTEVEVCHGGYSPYYMVVKGRDMLEQR